MFDFGGVLISPITEKVQRLAARHGVSVPELATVLLGSADSTHDHPWHRAERGELPVSAIQGLLTPWAQAAGLVLDGDEIGIMLTPGDYRYHTEVVARVGTLKAQGYLVGLLTNSFAEFRPVLAAEMDLEQFDAVIDSSDVGARKPEAAIYDRTTVALGVEAHQIVYLDDFIQNIDGARRAGWATVHVTSPEQALADLDALLDAGLG